MVFTLHKNNLLFGGLNKSLETAVNNYKKWYTFSNIYLVSDSKEKSWRKKINSNYKTNRKKDTDIDWEFVYSTYDDFKQSQKSKGIKILEAPHIEGDDWISFLVEKSNLDSRSTIIVSNDHDIKQLISYSIGPEFINIMSNEMQSRQRIFVPKNYQIFLDSVNKESEDIFSLNDNKDFYKLIQSFLKRCEISEVSGIESLLIKLISGDTSDNINSCWSQVKNGKKRGIAEKGAQSIFNDYLTNFGEPDIKDPDLSENIADLICEKKKLPKSNITQIKSNIEENMKLIHLDTNVIPKEILNKMSNIFSTYDN
jgi:5'-3' exonuclease